MSEGKAHRDFLIYSAIRKLAAGVGNAFQYCITIDIHTDGSIREIRPGFAKRSVSWNLFKD